MLTIAENLKLPLDAVTQTFAILAKRGAGKTYTAAVLTEELLKAGLHVVVVDPIGVWWGLRSSADGKHEGLPITVLGGEHGDVPLEIEAGELIADFVVQERASCVLDLSRFRKGEQIRFMTSFAEKLYHANRLPLHLVLDEADAFAPQRPQKGQERLLGAKSGESWRYSAASIPPASIEPCSTSSPATRGHRATLTSRGCDRVGWWNSSARGKCEPAESCLRIESGIATRDADK